MLSIRIGLGDVFALDIHAHVFAGDGGIEHVGNSEARFGINFNAPVVFKLTPDFVVLYRPVTR